MNSGTSSQKNIKQKKYPRKIAMPFPTVPFIIDPTPGRKTLTIKWSAGFFGATAVPDGPAIVGIVPATTVGVGWFGAGPTAIEPAASGALASTTRVPQVGQ
jgi:hypothetical protein